MKLSIIIPTLNEARSLPALLSSIKDQDFTDYEIIVADNNSTDGTKRVAEESGCKIVPGGMPAVGRNNGAKIAKGKYLLFLDADVILSGNFINDAINEMEYKDIDVATCSIIPISEKMIDAILHEVANAYIFLTQYFYPHAPGFCILIKKKLHDKIGGFDESLKLAEDHDYVKRAEEEGKFRLLKKAKVFVSIRRLKSDGRLNVSTKYLLCELYRMMMGEIRTDAFRYKFGHHEENKK